MRDLKIDTKHVLADIPWKDVPYRGRDYSMIVTDFRSHSNLLHFLLDKTFNTARNLNYPVGKEILYIRLQQVS
jgi:hypothetical protein